MGASPAHSATALPGTGPPKVHMRTNGRVTYGANWHSANHAYRPVAAKTTTPMTEIAAYAHGMSAGTVAPTCQ